MTVLPIVTHHAVSNWGGSGASDGCGVSLFDGAETALLKGGVVCYFSQTSYISPDDRSMREGRHGFGVVVGASLAAAMMIGCAIERPGLSASSLNPSPWFNFQLAPKKKEVSNHQRSIARTSADQVTVKPAVTPVQKEIRWPELSLPGRRREAQLIPRTDDIAKLPSEPQSTTFDEEAIDFN